MTCRTCGMLGLKCNCPGSMSGESNGWDTLGYALGICLMLAVVACLSGCTVSADPARYPWPGWVALGYVFALAAVVFFGALGYREVSDRGSWWVMALALLCMLTACQSTEGVHLDSSPQDTAERAGCQPLPVCEIPPAASSTQLESALWSCVLEYRALYSACYHLAHPAPPTADAAALPVCDHRTAWPRRIPRARCGRV